MGCEQSAQMVDVLWHFCPTTSLLGLVIAICLRLNTGDVHFIEQIKSVSAILAIYPA